MVLAEKGWPPTSLVLITLLGGTLAAGGANAGQHVRRPRHRRPDGAYPGPPARHGRDPAPQRPRRSPSPWRSLAFAVLWGGANLLSAVLALARRRVLRRRVHDLAEAHEPPEHRDRRRRRRRAGPRRMGRGAGFARLAAGLLFLAMFFWTPPHFWALAIKYADDYRAADVPMLPAVAPIETVVRQMIAYTVALVATTLLLVPVADLGWIYGVSAAVLGAVFIAGDDRPRPRTRPRPPACGCSATPSPTSPPLRSDDPRRVRPVRLVNLMDVTASKSSRIRRSGIPPKRCRASSLWPSWPAPRRRQPRTHTSEFPLRMTTLETAETAAN